MVLWQVAGQCYDVHGRWHNMMLWQVARQCYDVMAGGTT